MAWQVACPSAAALTGASDRGPPRGSARPRPFLLTIISGLVMVLLHAVDLDWEGREDRMIPANPGQPG